MCSSQFRGRGSGPVPVHLVWMERKDAELDRIFSD